jgi:RimJ/RimL family protein N-acetyltransferase
MQRVAFAPLPAGFTQSLSHTWLARRWYYTPKTHRAYSVRQVSPGDRRLLAEFMHTLGRAADSEQSTSGLTSLLFDRVIAAGNETAVAFAALENTQGGDRVVGACAYAPLHDHAFFNVAVANTFRNEQVGRTLLEALVRHAKRVGVRRLTGVVDWSNQAMKSLATSTGFTVEPLPGDRTRRNLVLHLR